MTPMDRHPVPLAPLHDLNGRCLDLLVHAARAGSAPPPSLAYLLRETLIKTTPETRRRAAARNFLLLDLEFRNFPWWQAVTRCRARSGSGTPLRSPFPRHSAMGLTRATLTVAWQAIQFDFDTACVLLGVEPAVATLIVELPVTMLDRIAVQHHEYIQPRWTDRPAYWRDLLQAAEGEDRARLRALDAQGLQLLASDQLTNRHSRSHRTRTGGARTPLQPANPVEHPT